MAHKNAAHRTNNIYHLDYVPLSECAGTFDMPVITRDHIIPADLMGFNYVKTNVRRETGVHFFLDDYQFERIWKRPFDYVERLRHFACVLSPDFSLYLNMPTAMKIWNTYRNRLIGRYLQEHGCRVIPTVSWAERASFQYCFDGLPTQGTVAVSAVGVKRDPAALAAWHDGMDALLERLRPTSILFYGQPIQRDYGSAELHVYPNRVVERMSGHGR